MNAGFKKTKRAGRPVSLQSNAAQRLRLSEWLRKREGTRMGRQRIQRSTFNAQRSTLNENAGQGL